MIVIIFKNNKQKIYFLELMIKQINIVKNIQHMTKKTHLDEELKISEFIKQPTSLKLLILAGTNIRSTQLPTISKCTGLIKLDLSNNFLGQVPLKFSLFQNLKILYLHDNQIVKVQITKTSLEYVSLFSNPIKWYEYRLQLITIDKNIISSKQRILAHNLDLSFNSKQFYNQKLTLPLYTELKWPIVQISASLEQQDDYLNLLKAEIFVINNVSKRTTKIQNIQRIFQGVIGKFKYKQIEINGGLQGSQNRRSWICAIKAAKKWKQYTVLRRKLRKILQKKGKQYLLLNRIQQNKFSRSVGVSLVMDAFLPLMRKKMNARGAFQRNINSFRKFIPTKKLLYSQYLGFTQDRDLQKQPIKFYFKDSQYQILSKVTLYAKKLLFQQKQYDICDDFKELFKQSYNKYIILRQNIPYQDQRSWLINTIHETKGLVLKKYGIDRRHFLYNRRGHKKITVKSIQKPLNPELYLERKQAADRKIEYIEQKYDKLIEYEVKNYKILETMLKIIRYINAGNASTVVLTQTAYFQTQVTFEDNKQQQKNKERVKFYLGLQFFVKRVNAATIIQRFWRKHVSQQKSKINVIKRINNKRAGKLINKWFSNIIFNHRMLAVQMKSYYSSTWNKNQVYLHLDIYMNLPQPTNFLRYPNYFQSKQQFYNIFHKKTQIQIIQAMGRKWIKITYPNIHKAYQAQIKLYKNTYRYYYRGFSLKLFTNDEIKDSQNLKIYQERVKKMYGIVIQTNQVMERASVLWIDNMNPYFVWSEMELQTTKKIFFDYQKKSTNVNIFIYNKHKRPLKVSCEIYWTQPQSIYLRTRKIKSISHSGNIKQISSAQNSLLMKGKNTSKLSNLDDSLKKSYQIDMPIRKSRNKDLSRKSSSKKTYSLIRSSHRTRIVSDPRLELLSETLNIRRK